ncbi:MAG: hypothetical protein AB9836_03145 [Aminipila sp.]
MGNTKDILEWFITCFKAIPEDIVIGLYVSLIFWIIRLVINKISKVNIKIKLFMEKLFNFIKNSPEINVTYRVIPSPQYNYNCKVKDNKSASTYVSDNAALFFIFIFLLIGTNYLHNNYETIQVIFYTFSAVFIGLSSFFIFVSTFFNRIQSSTLKYCTISTLLSLYIGYNALYLPNFIEKMPQNINIGDLLVNPNESWASVYSFIGIVIVGIEIIISLVLLLRVCIIKIDSIKSFRFTQKLICSTKPFDSMKSLIIIGILLTVLSYLMTSGILINWIFS